MQSWKAECLFAAEINRRTDGIFHSDYPEGCVDQLTAQECNSYTWTNVGILKKGKGKTSSEVEVCDLAIQRGKEFSHMSFPGYIWIRP